MENFVQGYRLGQNDLILNMFARYISSRPDETFPYTPFWIRYDVGFIYPLTNQFTPIEARNRIPVIEDTGKVRPNFIIGEGWKAGVYEIRWYYRATDTSNTQITPVQFSVSSDGMHSPEVYSGNQFDVNAFMILY